MQRLFKELRVKNNFFFTKTFRIVKNITKITDFFNLRHKLFFIKGLKILLCKENGKGML